MTYPDEVPRVAHKRARNGYYCALDRLTADYKVFATQRGMPPLSLATLYSYLAEHAATDTYGILRQRYYCVATIFRAEGMFPRTNEDFNRAYKRLFNSCAPAKIRPTYYIDDRTLRRLLDSLGDDEDAFYDRAFILLCYTTGASSPQINRLRKSDVVRYAQGLEIVLRSGQRERTVRIVSHDHPQYCPVRALLARMAQSRTEYVFGNVFTGRPWAESVNVCRPRLQKRLAAIELPSVNIGLPALRRGAVITALRRGVDDFTIKRQLGFLGIETVQKWRSRITGPHPPEIVDPAPRND